MNAVLRTQLGGVARRPARLLLTGLAVLVVSFVVYATVLAQQMTVRTLLNGLSDTPAATDLVVQDGQVTTAMLAGIRTVGGVAEAAGRVEAGGQLGSDYLQLVADPGSGPLAVAKLASGKWPTGPDEIAVTPRTAERMGLHVGTTFPLALRYDAKGKPEAPARLTVVGTVTVPDDNGYAGYAPQAAVTALIGTDELDHIDVRLAPGADRQAVQAKIQAVLAGGTHAASDGKPPHLADGADVRRTEAEQKASGVNDIFTVVGMFVAIAVVAAGLVATSTFRIVFAQRMRQLALLRAVGAGQGSIRWSLAVEGALIGLVTGLSGVLLALAAGSLTPVLLGAFGLKVAGPGFPLAAAAGTVALAVVITVLAVVAPAFAAAKVSPLEALRGASTTGSRQDVGKLRWAVGIVLVLGAVALAGLVGTHLPGRDPKNYDPKPMLLAVIASGTLAFFALVALGPVLVRPVLAAVGWPIRRAGSIGRLAAGGVGGAPRRAAAVSVVVALGVTLVAGVLVAGASARVLADRDAASSAPADYEVTAATEDKPLPGAIARQVAARSELTHVVAYRRLDVKLAGAKDGLDANDLDIAALPELKKLDVVAGSLHDLGPGAVAISGFTADNTGLRVGDTATLTHGQASVRLKVVAELPDTAPLGSGLVVAPADLTALGAPAGAYAGVLADASGGGERGRSDGRKAISDVIAANGGGGVINVLADQRDAVNSELDVLLAVALGLIGLTVLIAVVGVGTTTALSVVERVREAGLLRAIGLSRSGLRTMLTTEAALYGVIGAAIGLALGVPYAWLFVQAIGVNAPLSLPLGQLAAVFVVLVLLTALSGVLPARRAAKVSPVAALGTE